MKNCTNGYGLGQQAILVMSLLAFAPSVVSAGPIFRFTGVTNNNATNTAAGVNQLAVEVIDGGLGKVRFKFTNTGPRAMSITDLYWDDGTLLGIANITDSGTTVSFSQGASPGNLPGGNAINFHTTAGFSADSNTPTQPNGVNPGEWVTVTFNLLNGYTYTETIALIHNSLAHPGVDMQPGLRIGIHVQGFGNGGSESFVNGGEIGGGTTAATPAPSTLALAASGLVGFGLAGLRRFRRRATA